MRRLSITIALIGIVAPAVHAQEQNPVEDPARFSPWRHYASDFAPPLGAVYRNESATFVLDGPKKAGLADYRWFDGRHFRDGLQFDPSCSMVHDQSGAGIEDVGYLYRVPNEPFWFFFSDEGFDIPGKDNPAIPGLLLPRREDVLSLFDPRAAPPASPSPSPAAVPRAKRLRTFRQG